MMLFMRVNISKRVTFCFRACVLQVEQKQRSLFQSVLKFHTAPFSVLHFNIDRDYRKQRKRGGRRRKI